ncbi:MAG: hypothetical protein K9H48_07910 [Melioribacteraceae bacterium]|nr:hypothetical protein [Melioribacteraceae bacterium]
MLINIVQGNRVYDDGSNLECFESDVKPNIGEKIRTKEFGLNEVRGIVIDYTNVQWANEDDRGSEFIFVFI